MKKNKCKKTNAFIILGLLETQLIYIDSVKSRIIKKQLLIIRKPSDILQKLFKTFLELFMS
jgi:hypothetical protein